MASYDYQGTQEEIINGVFMFEHYKKAKQWFDIKKTQPTPNTEVIVFYLEILEDETSSYTCEIMHEKFIKQIESPFIYWVYFPEIRY